MTAPTFVIGEIGHYCNRNDVTRWYITCQYTAVYISIPWFICGKEIALNVLCRTYMPNFRHKTPLDYRLKLSERILVEYLYSCFNSQVHEVGNNFNKLQIVNYKTNPALVSYA